LRNQLAAMLPQASALCRAGPDGGMATRFACALRPNERTGLGDDVPSAGADGGRSIAARAARFRAAYRIDREKTLDRSASVFVEAASA